MYQDLNKSHQKKILWRIPFFFFFFFYLQDKKGSKTLYLLHLLLHNKIPLKLNSQSNKHITLYRVSWVLGIRKGLAGWFWPTVSHKVTVKTLAWAAVMWRLDWGWRICFQDSTPRWLLAGGLCCLHRFLQRTADDTASPRVSDSKKRGTKTKSVLFYNLNLEWHAITSTLFHRPHRPTLYGREIPKDGRDWLPASQCHSRTSPFLT